VKSLPKLVIAGAGGFGRELHAWAQQSVQFDRDWVIKGLIDDNPDALTGRRTTAVLLGTIRDYEPGEDEVFLCGVGVPLIKRAIMEVLVQRDARLATLVHRTAVLGDGVVLEEGAILCPYSIVSSNNRIGRCSVIGVHSSVDHDANVDDWSQINGHCDLTAAVAVGKGVFLGSSVTVLPNVTIGDGALIGAGSVVTRNVPAGATAYGVPARVRTRIASK